MISVGGRPCKAISLALTWSGLWIACATFEGSAPTGRVTIDWRGWTLAGTVDPERAGSFAGEPAARIVGGIGWQTVLEPKAYQDDRGLTARELATVIAGGIGESITVAAASDRNLGPYFVVRRESAGAVASRLFGRAWYVDASGATYAGARPAATLGSSVAVLRFYPSDKRAELYADRPDQAPIGALLPADARLSSPRRITRLAISATGTQERIVAYTEAA